MLHILIEIVQFPYDYWKHTTEKSRFGPSKLEENTLRFWKWFAFIATILLCVLFVIIPIINKSPRIKNSNPPNSQTPDSHSLP